MGIYNYFQRVPEFRFIKPAMKALTYSSKKQLGYPKIVLGK